MVHYIKIPCLSVAYTPL